VISSLSCTAFLSSSKEELYIPINVWSGLKSYSHSSISSKGLSKIVSNSLYPTSGTSWLLDWSSRDESKKNFQRSQKGFLTVGLHLTSQDYSNLDLHLFGLKYSF
jgi:hypothetical protein